MFICFQVRPLQKNQTQQEYNALNPQNPYSEGYVLEISPAFWRKNIHCMECRAYCTASSYEIQRLYESFRGMYHTNSYRDVIHVQFPLEEGSGDIFYFSYGVMVTWGLSSSQCRQLLVEVKKFEHQPISLIETDDFQFFVGDKPKIDDEQIILTDEDPISKLAISYGIAQSVKLGAFEDMIHNTFTLTKHIPEELAKHGKISLSRKEIRRKMGELFLDRSSINLHLDVLDTPEFFWDHSELEILYRLAAVHLDLENRVEVLNQRLMVVHELFEMLGNELNHQHSSRLEWTIIWLILIEVSLLLLRDILRVI